MEMKMSNSRISFHISISSEEDEEGKKHNADYGYPLSHIVTIDATYDSDITWLTLLEKSCEAIGAYYGYDVKDKVFVERFGHIINIFGHEENLRKQTDITGYTDSDENPAT
jgi:hypothetical protein